jgi:hypothetical protein
LSSRTIAADVVDGDRVARENEPLGHVDAAHTPGGQAQHLKLTQRQLRRVRARRLRARSGTSGR